MLWMIYICEVLRCNEPHVSWQMEQPILFFINYVYVTDVTSQSQMLLALIVYYCYMAHDVIMEACRYQGGHQALVFWTVFFSLSSGDLPAPHPICVAAGICQCFYLAMVH